MSDKLKSRKALMIYGISALSAAFLCVILRVISMLFFFDDGIGYFESDAVLPIISNILAVMAIVVSLVFFAIPSLRLSPNTPADTKTVRISSIAPLVGSVIFFVVYVVSLIELMDISGEISRSFILTAICSAVTMIFFLLKLLGKSGSVFYVICGIFTVAWSVLALMTSYFNMNVQMNAPLKAVFQFACLGAMLITVSEMRVGVDSTRTRFHLLTATVSSILLPLSAIPSLICYALDALPLTYELEYFDIVFLFLSVLPIIRLVQMCFFKPTVTTEDAPEEISYDTDTEETV